MVLVSHRRLPIPLWAVVFLMVALTTSPPAATFPMPLTTLFVIAVVGFALIVFTMPAIPGLRASRSLVQVLPSRRRDRTAAAVTAAAATSVRAPDAPHRSTADDALDTARMDDDGGSQMMRPPA